MSEEDYCQVCADKAAREYRKPVNDDGTEEIPEAPEYAVRPCPCECKTGKGNWQNIWRLAWVGCTRPGDCEAERTCCGCEYSIGEICPCVTPGGMR